MKRKDGIYADYCNGDKSRLVCRKALVSGRLFLVITSKGKVIAMKPWEEANREMYSPGPCLILDEDGNVLDGEI